MGGVSRYTATPLIAALSAGHGDVTRFRPGSPIATGYRFNLGLTTLTNDLTRSFERLSFHARL